MLIGGQAAAPLLEEQITQLQALPKGLSKSKNSIDPNMLQDGHIHFTGILDKISKFKIDVIIPKDFNIEVPEKRYAAYAQLFEGFADQIEGRRESYTQEQIGALRGLLNAFSLGALRFFMGYEQYPINQESQRIELGEAGISAEKPIGVSGVGNCVALILRNPETYKTLVAHIDKKTDIASLDNLVPEFQTATSEKPKIDVQIYGAKVFPDCKNSETLSKISAYNLRRTLKYLKGKNTNIRAAYVGESFDTPHLVVDPITGSVYPEVPGLATKYTMLALGKRLLETDKDLPLNMAFDLTRSYRPLSFHLNQEQTSALREYSGKPIESLYIALRENDNLDNYALPSAVVFLMRLVESYEAEVRARIASKNQLLNNSLITSYQP